MSRWRPRCLGTGVRRTLLALLVVLVGLGAAAAPPASAATWVVNSCHRDDLPAVDEGLEWFAMYVGYVHGQRSCPYVGLTLGVDARSTPGMAMAWQYSWSEERQHPKMLRMRLHGGDTSNGVEYGIASCAGCTPYANFGPRGPADDEHADAIVEVDVSTADGIFLTANCLREGCTTSRDLEVSDIELVFEDTTPPEIGFSAVLRPEAFSGAEPAWLQPRQEPAVIDVSDAGAGMGTAVALLDHTHQPFWEASTGCDLSAFVPSDWARLCVAGLSYYAKSLDLSGLADGPHQLRLSATDAVGNAAPDRVLDFQIDGTPPEPLTGLRVDGSPAPTAAGWTSAPVGSLHWDVPAPDGGAPVTEVHYRLESIPRVPGAQADVTTEPAGTGQLRFPREGAWRVAAWAQDAAGNLGDKEYRAIGFDTDVPAPPQLVGNGWLSKADLLAGARQTWAAPAPQPALESGVCGYAVDVSRLRDGDPGREIAVAAPKTAWPITGPLVDGRHYVHVRAVSCAGRASAPAFAALEVDTVAPSASLAGAPAADWSPEPFVARLTASDERSGVDHVQWTLDGGPLQTAAGAAAEIAVGEGVHDLVYAAVDVAGNVSEARHRRLQVDSAAPETAFEPRDADHPAVIQARVRDGLSGVERAWIELRPDAAADAPWQRIGPIVEPPPPGGEAVVTGELPDASLPAGRYALRVVATDRAGNSTDTSRQRPLAEPPTVMLPVRAPVALQVAIGRANPTCVTSRGRPCAVDRRCPALGCTRGTAIDAAGASTQRVLRYAEQAAIVGSLTTADGAALADAAVEVSITTVGGPSVRHELRTGADGHFQEALPLGASRTVTVRFAGTARLGAADATATLAVRSGVTLRLSRATQRGGKSIGFSGQVSGAPGVSLAGKLVLVQFARGKRWVPTVDAIRTDGHGRFRAAWRLSPVSRRARIEFRAFVPRDGTWPFEDGGSTPRFLTVTR